MQTDSHFGGKLLQNNAHDSDSDLAEFELNCNAIVDEFVSEPSTCKQNTPCKVL